MKAKEKKMISVSVVKQFLADKGVKADGLFLRRKPKPKPEPKIRFGRREKKRLLAMLAKDGIAGVQLMRHSGRVYMIKGDKLNYKPAFNFDNPAIRNRAIKKREALTNGKALQRQAGAVL